MLVKQSTLSRTSCFRHGPRPLNQISTSINLILLMVLPHLELVALSSYNCYQPLNFITMNQSHAQVSDLAITLRSVIESSIAAALQRHPQESSERLIKQIERAVDSMLDSVLQRRLRPLHSQPNTNLNLTAPSIAAIEPVAQIDLAPHLTNPTPRSNTHSQHVPEASPEASVRSAVVGRKRPAPVSKPAKWDIVDLTDVCNELPEKSLDVTSLIGHEVANMIDGLVPEEQGDRVDIICGEEANGHSAAALEIPESMVREAWQSMQKRFLEEMGQPAPSVDTDADIDSADRNEGILLDSDENISQASDSDDSEESEESEESQGCEPEPKRARKTITPPGFSNGPPIKFLKVCNLLTANARRRGWPRVVNLKNFSKESNKQNLTMADIVATILWKHGRSTLEAFLDFEGHSDFYFGRRNPIREGFSICRCSNIISVCNFDLPSRKLY